jgi:MFS superfamily sulfate permease-like transporter
MKLSSIGLFLPVLLSGLYAGVGFFVIMGGNPATIKMSERTFAEFWQHIDFYMAARMKFFGPLLLLSVIAGILLQIRDWQTPSFWLFVLALVILIIDIITFVNINHPLNTLIQSWDLNNLPANVSEIKDRVVYGFWIRSACMIGSFVCILIATFLAAPQKN